MHSYVPITDREVPVLVQEQLDKFTYTSIHAEKLFNFDPMLTLETLRNSEGARAIGADFGGDKVMTKLYIVRNGRLEIDEEFEDHVQSTNGTGYLESLKKTAEFVSKNNIPIGISWGGPVDGTRPLFHPKLSVFLEALTNEYNGDFKNVLPTLTACLNDGPAGLISGIVAASKTKKVTAALLPINGGGFGMAALVGGNVYSTEAGHVEAVGALNTYQQTKPCGVFGASYVCIETLGANKAGIEAQWEARNGYMRAVDIENEFKSGDQFAGELYDHSAFVIAHMIVGTAKALQVDLTSESAVVVGHGGAFKFPDYDKRVRQIIAHYLGGDVNLMTTYSYSDRRSNACVEGAALAALLKVSNG